MEAAKRRQRVSVRQPDTIYLIDILCDVAHHCNEPLHYVLNDMPWRKVWAVWFSLLRRREDEAEAAQHNPLGALSKRH